jgi:hypothetical protein
MRGLAFNSQAVQLPAAVDDELVGLDEGDVAAGVLCDEPCCFRCRVGKNNALGNRRSRHQGTKAVG